MGNQSLIRVLKRDHWQQCQQIPDVTVEANDTDFSKWIVTIDGAVGTPYEGGKFQFLLHFKRNNNCQDFPSIPPTCLPLTRIYHPSFQQNIPLCLETFWAEEEHRTVAGLISDLLKRLLHCPSDELGDANNGAVRVFKENAELFEDKARNYTRAFAIKD